MSLDQKPLAAFMLSLLSGVFIILGGSVWCLWLDGHLDMGWMGGMMHGWEEHTHSWGFEGTISYSMGLLGIVFGAVVIIAAVMLYLNPIQHAMGRFDNRLLCDKPAELYGRDGSRIDTRNHRGHVSNTLETIICVSRERGRVS